MSDATELLKPALHGDVVLAGSDRLEEFTMAHPDVGSWWANAPCGDWMLWFGATAGLEPRLLVKAAARCVQRVSELVPERDPLPKQALDAATEWAEGSDNAERCAALSDRVFATNDYNPDYADPMRVAAAMAASGAAEAVASAAGRSHDRELFATLLAAAGRRTITALWRSGEDRPVAEQRVAEIVRRVLPPPTI